MSAARTPSRTSPNTAGWIAIIIFVFLAGLGTIAALATVAVFKSVSDGLKSASALTNYVLPEETIVYDRTGTIELARFGDYKRELVSFNDIPKVLLDATTAVEDKTFWDNAGFDPVAIVSASIASLRGDSRGASTITQQLVRNTLLDEDLVKDPNRTAERKLKEIIQSIRLTETFQLRVLPNPAKQGGDVQTFLEYRLRRQGLTTGKGDGFMGPMSSMSAA